MLNPIELDGEPTLVEVHTPDIKLREKPTLVIAIPCGDKEVNTVLTCPKHLGGCGQKYLVPGMRAPLLAPVRFNLALPNLQKPLNMVTATMAEAGRLSSEARQIMTKKAIRMEAKYILYIDDDTIPPADGMGLYKLINFLERNQKIGAVTGIVPTRVDPPEPVVYKAHGVGAYWDLPMGPGAVPQPVFGSGAAFMLARVSMVADVIEQMKEENDGVEIPIWADQKAFPGELADVDVNITHLFGHDVRFCYLMNKHGYPVYAHGQVLCGHLDIASDRTFWLPEDGPGFTGPRDFPKPVADTPSVEVIVVKYNQPELEQKTLDAVKDNTIYSNYTVKTHTNPPGVSLAKCWNALIEASDADYVCLLNPDTVPAEGWLTKLMSAVIKPDVGVVVPSSNIVHMSQIPTSLERYEERLKTINKFAKSLSAELEYMDTASAMCAVFAKSVWEDAGKFDEEFMLYGEDTEFFWRLKNKLNLKIVWVKDSYVHHYKAQSVDKAVFEEGLDVVGLRKRAAELVNQKTDLEVLV